MKRKNKPEAVLYTPDTTSPLTGTFVTSGNGRYADRIFLILGSESEGFVLMTDGKKRRLACPKRKRLSHIVSLGTLEGVPEMIRSGEITDGKIRKLINQIRRMRIENCADPKSYKEE